VQKIFLLTALVLLASAKLGAQPAQSASNPLPPVSEYLNEELPNWLRIGGEFRSRLEGFTGGGGFKKDTTDDYLLTRLRINLKIEPARWLRIFVQGQDSHALWKNQHPEAPPFQSTMNLRQAYLELGDTTKGPIGFRVGRQELAFGEERLIGPSGWLNTPRFFEAARLTLRHGRYRVDAFASSVIVVQAEHYSKAQPPNNLHGLYGGIDNLIPNSTIEPYVLWRLQRNLRTEAGKPGNMDYKAGGVRWAGKVAAAFDYSIEVLTERGSLGTDSIGAWGGHWLVGHTFEQSKYKPRVYGEYNYASGDKNPADGKRGTFDMIYPTAHDRWGLADQVGWRNIHDVHPAFEIRVHPKVLLKTGYHSYWLASATDGLYAANGTQVARVPSGTAGTHVGQEVDIQAAWQIFPTLQVLPGFANLAHGAFLKKATQGQSYRYPFLSVLYTF
jgi:hypothetical protein